MVGSLARKELMAVEMVIWIHIDECCRALRNVFRKGKGPQNVIIDVSISSTMYPPLSVWLYLHSNRVITVIIWFRVTLHTEGYN